MIFSRDYLNEIGDFSVIYFIFCSKVIENKNNPVQFNEIPNILRAIK